MTPKVKTILTVCGIVASFPVLITLLILFRDYLNIIVIFITFSSCIAITCYGLYQEISEELRHRHYVHEMLYHGKSKEYARRLDFYLDYFGVGEYK